MEQASLYSAGLTPPKEPHLVVIDAATREGTGIPIGSLMGLVLDAKSGDVVPLILCQVQRMFLKFRCGCGDPQCTLIYTFRAVTTGKHRRVVHKKA